MSYILDALRKADQERLAGSVPDLEADHESSRAEGRSFRLAWLLGIILVLNGVLLAVLLWRGGSQDEAPVAGAAPAAERPARVVAAPPPAVVLSRPAPRPAAPAPVSRPAPAVPPAPEPPVVRPVAQAPDPAPVAVADPQSPAERGDGVPYWEDLSLEFRSDFDPPRLDVHVYDSNPQRRFLLIELKKYREGDTLANGALIEEIQPDGILVFYRGTRFIYRK